MKQSDDRFHAIWARDRLICRLVAAWSWFAVFVLTRGGDFTELAFGQDYSFYLAGLWTLGGFFFLTLMALAGHPWHTDSWFLLGGATVCVWHWLVGGPQDDSKYLFWLAVCAAYIVFVLYFIHANGELFRRWSPGRRTVIAVAIVAALASCIIISTITCLRYLTFASPNYDFGIFVNMFHNMRESGLPMVTSERDGLLSHFAVHISPTYYLLLPFYWLFPSPLTLQIGQAVVLMLGMIPVVLLARHFGLSGKTTIVVSLLYAFFPALCTGCFYDIHENCFLPLFLLLTFYFYETRRPVPMYLSAVCVLGVKEDAAIYLIVFALYLLLSRRSYLHGLLLLVMSGGWFVLATHLINTYGDGVLSNRIDNLSYDPDMGLLGVIKTALVNPGFLLTQMFTTSGGTWDKVVYFLQMLLPLGFLPFCTKKLSRWLLIAPMLINLFTRYQYLYDLGFQYHFGNTAFLMYAVILNLPELSRTWRRSLLGVAAACCLCLYLCAVVPRLGSYVTRWNDGKETYARMEELLDTVPEDASVNCSTFLLPHMADRSEIYEIGYHGDKPDVDYVVIDARYQGWRDTMKAYLAQGYEVQTNEPGLIVILRRAGA